MSQAHAQVYLHSVFSTKHRHPFLQDKELRAEMHRILGGASNSLDCPVLRVGGVADHVHVLCRFGRTMSIADYIKEMKRESSKWVKTKGSTVADFYGQGGYGAFSISPSHVDDLIAYIENQEEHHRTETFQDEFRRLLAIYGVEWDERYVWD